MTLSSRHIVVDEDFDRVILDVLRALQDQRLEIAARVDTRELVRRTTGRDFRRHLAFEVWSPDLAVEAIGQDLEGCVFLMLWFVIYELADGETAIAVCWPRASDPVYRREHPQLAAAADAQCVKAEHVLAGFRHKTREVASVA